MNRVILTRLGQLDNGPTLKAQSSPCVTESVYDQVLVMQLNNILSTVIVSNTICKYVMILQCLETVM